MREILFVDDEQLLLDGLRRMLRSKRTEWNMSFINGGESALEFLRETSVDVVVSDMRMPGMDGGQFLAAVRLHYPQTARMILSGHADRASIISAVGPTQQFLAKPCDADTLIGAVDRVLALRDVVTDEKLRKTIGEVDTLPKPPQVYEEMIAAATDPECQIEQVVAVIKRDVATTAEVLHLVNSSFFGLAASVDSVDRAVALLGLETIQALAIAGAVFRSAGNSPPGVSYQDISQRGLEVASISRRFAVAAGWGRQAISDAFFAGLLCEIGLPVLATSDPAAWEIVRKSEAKDPWSVDQVQREAFGVSATMATAYLLGLWGFPQAVVQSLAEQPALPGDSLTTPAPQLLTWARQIVLDPDCELPTEADSYYTVDRMALLAAARDGTPHASQR
jgi:HD-like signal output (HDOD) protein/CheY-like chemotaxis protein